MIRIQRCANYRMFLENQLVANASFYILTHINKKSTFFLRFVWEFSVFCRKRAYKILFTYGKVVL